MERLRVLFEDGQGNDMNKELPSQGCCAIFVQSRSTCGPIRNNCKPFFTHRCALCTEGKELFSNSLNHPRLTFNLFRNILCVSNNLGLERETTGRVSGAREAQQSNVF